ncbi:MAG: DUF1800 domain-containing protein [Acidobacteria bacterium]|nr:DUF1800 domain-containing protein [Acidobacteriota bacterium]
MQTLRRLSPVLLSAIVAMSLAIDGRIVGAQKSSGAVPPNPDDRTIVHILNRIGFGAAPGDIDRVRRIGLQTYIEQQLQPERVDDGMAARLAQFETLAKSSRDLAEEYFVPAMMERRQQKREQSAAAEAPQRDLRSPEQLEAMRVQRKVLSELTQQKILRAAYSNRQLEEVMVDFWFNHFNVFAGKGPTRMYLTEYERDAIRPHVFGKFRDLLQATAESPAMLFFLDNWQSVAPVDARRPRNANAESAGQRPGPQAGGRRVRPEMMTGTERPLQRPQRGLNENYARELMELHTLGVDGGYTQKDVQEVARAFTGWTIEGPRRGGGFRFDPRVHDHGDKTVLGHHIKAGGGKGDGERVLGILANHPATARFVATKLTRRFIADDPPASVVTRASTRFRETGGDIREVVRTIITSPEFFAKQTYRAKVKTPFEFVASAVRTTGIEIANAEPIAQALRSLGMPLYHCQPPTGYADRADAWVNTGALLNRMNFAVALASGNLRGARGGGSPRPVVPSGAREIVVQSALAGDLSRSTVATVDKATTDAQALALLLGSPEFQRR